MKLRRIGALLLKEYTQGAKNFFLIFGALVPIVATLVISLVFGSLFDSPLLSQFFKNLCEHN